MVANNLGMLQKDSAIHISQEILLTNSAPVCDVCPFWLTCEQMAAS